jgi:glycosyltransferase involved in cell wall biosynthesis
MKKSPTERTSPITELTIRIQQHGPRNVVHVLEPKYGDEKFRLIKESDIFVLPTHFEAFRGTKLEAMQFGISVISTVEGPFQDSLIMEKHDFWCKKYNVDDLVHAIEMLIKQTQVRVEFGSNGRKEFETNYTMEYSKGKWLPFCKARFFVSVVESAKRTDQTAYHSSKKCT